MIIYDIEIKKAIQSNKEPRIPNIEYCDGWHDHKNMGISVIGVYDYIKDKYRIFQEDNFLTFADLISQSETIVTFNGIGFDKKLLQANNLNYPDEKDYDLLAEIWEAAGLSRHFQYPSHIGYGLGDICSINFGTDKSGSGGNAPVQWQQKRFGTVIDYCLNDIKLTKQLLDHIIKTGTIINPINEKKIRVKRPI